MLVSFSNVRIINIISSSSASAFTYWYQVFVSAIEISCTSVHGQYSFAKYYSYSYIIIIRRNITLKFHSRIFVVFYIHLKYANSIIVSGMCVCLHVLICGMAKSAHANAHRKYYFWGNYSAGKLERGKLNILNLINIRECCARSESNDRKTTMNKQAKPLLVQNIRLIPNLV